MKIYTVVFSHKHGIDAWPVSEEPDEKEIIKELMAADLLEEGEIDRFDTYIEIMGPVDFPRHSSSGEYTEQDISSIVESEEGRTHFFDGLACCLLGVGVPDTNVEFSFGAEYGKKLKEKFADLTGK